MIDVTRRPYARSTRPVGRFSRKVWPRSTIGVAALTMGVWTGAVLLDVHPTATSAVDEAPRVAQTNTEGRIAATPVRYDPLLDPAVSLGSAPVTFAESAPLASTFVVAEVAASDPAVEPEVITPVVIAEAIAPPAVETVPVPTPRPPEFRSPPSRPPFRSARPLAPRIRMAAAPLAPVDHRSFFEKIFGVSEPTGPALAYAAPDDTLLRAMPRLAPSPMPSIDRWTAVYDITAHTVTLPNGTRLEAHSGLGNRLDDPRYVHERMRGPTPPHVYELTPREQLFHGVQALRLNPVGGGSIFGRNGLLAHSYMLGPNGDSNGCVSFRNYNAFLQAFLNGEVKRLVVVARQI